MLHNQQFEIYVRWGNTRKIVYTCKLWAAFYVTFNMYINSMPSILHLQYSKRAWGLRIWSANGLCKLALAANLATNTITWRFPMACGEWRKSSRKLPCWSPICGNKFNIFLYCPVHPSEKYWIELSGITKNPQPQTKNFFPVQPGKLADPFEPLNSSLVQGFSNVFIPRPHFKNVFSRQPLDG